LLRRAAWPCPPNAEPSEHNSRYRPWVYRIVRSIQMSFWDAMRERLREFSLSLHPDKTRLIEIGRFAAQNGKKRGRSKPETFKFLGFVKANPGNREMACFAGGQ
jgi:hypothetical protein